MAETQIFGYIGAVFIGLVLGLLGGGGSILTLPILVYLFHLNPVTATAYSLFVVGTTSLTGAINNYRKKLVELKTGLVFAFPAFVVVYCVRKFLIPVLPDMFYLSENVQFHLDFAIMTFFGLIMAITSIISSKPDRVCTPLSAIVSPRDFGWVDCRIDRRRRRIPDYSGLGLVRKTSDEESCCYFVAHHRC
jgi:uncharacterized membrane protein YfcA